MTLELSSSGFGSVPQFEVTREITYESAKVRKDDWTSTVAHLRLLSGFEEVCCFGRNQG